MKKTRQFEKITLLPCYKIAITYTDKSEVIVNLSSLIQTLEIFAPLENPTEFATAEISDFGFTLEWSNGASLDSDRVFEMARKQTKITEVGKSYHFWNHHEHHTLSQSTMQ